MKAQDVLDALKLPDNTRVDQRVPKKLFLEQGAPTAADKKAIQNGIEEALWIAALKPSNIGVPFFKDDTREYLEIAVVAVTLKTDSKQARITELIHRAIPYPLFLLATRQEELTISLAHKRASQSEKDAIVLDDEPFQVSLTDESSGHDRDLLESLALGTQPTLDLHGLYQGWIDRVQALMSARLTGHYSLTQTAPEALARQSALGAHRQITREISLLRAKATKERQINRRIDINLAIQRLEDELRTATRKLEGTQ